MKLEEAIKSNKFQDQKHKATLNVLYTAYWLRNNFSNAIKPEDLTVEQYNVLRILKGKHPDQMCVRDIGSRIIEKSSNVPRIIDRLVLKKLVKRTPSKVDKRETLISLTDKGAEVLLKANELIEGLNDTIKMDENEALMLNELLEKLRASEEAGDGSVI
ncbi:MAG: MarR family transcriptional regulator [Flavipsychrobacter sp.]|jgi:DNA-binding MarR family transcriptional regulator|nr:MarR family transcriptional regulator [Flavipsychrobacter sp.]